MVVPKVGEAVPTMARAGSTMAEAEVERSEEC